MPSPPQPKLAAFQPKKFCFQFASSADHCGSLQPQRRVIESPRKYTSMPPVFALATSCSCASIEFASERGAGIAAEPGLVVGIVVERGGGGGALMYWPTHSKNAGQFGVPSCPPSCWRQASWLPMSVSVGGIGSVR